jgi:hypothetical protein
MVNDSDSCVPPLSCAAQNGREFRALGRIEVILQQANIHAPSGVLGTKANGGGMHNAGKNCRHASLPLGNPSFWNE